MAKPSWISVTPQSGSNNGSLSVTADQNESYEKNGIVTVASNNITKTITVNQNSGFTFLIAELYKQSARYGTDFVNLDYTIKSTPESSVYGRILGYHPTGHIYKIPLKSHDTITASQEIEVIAFMAYDNAANYKLEVTFSCGLNPDIVINPEDILTCCSRLTVIGANENLYMDVIPSFEQAVSMINMHMTSDPRFMDIPFTFNINIASISPAQKESIKNYVTTPYFTVVIA